MSDILTKIEAYKREEIAAAKRANPLSNVQALARAAPPPRGFVGAIRHKLAGGEYALIAEVKKASPSKGLIRADFDPAKLARELEIAGATALSVLTDEEFFQGSLDYLQLASAGTQLPCLRKDFIVDQFQILEARAHHADAVLLILAALNDVDFRQFLARAHELELDALCEVHDEDELKRALDGGAEIIGVNSRDLRTFEVKLNTLRELAPKIPNRILRIAESGIANGAEIGELLQGEHSGRTRS